MQTTCKCKPLARFISYTGSECIESFERNWRQTEIKNSWRKAKTMTVLQPLALQLARPNII